MNVRRDIEEIFAEIMGDDYLMKQFYNQFGKNITLMNELFSHVYEMTAGERMIRLSVLPPIPNFLCDSKNKNFLKIHKDHFETIHKLTRIFNTEMANMTRILFYMSIPRHLYSEFPYLGDHYKFTEQIINFYLEKTDSENRLQLYDKIKNFI